MSSQISDEGIYEITKILFNEFESQKNMKQLDHDNLDEFKRIFIKSLYPHKESIENGQRVIEKYACSEYCCDISPGRFCCCNSTPPDAEYREFGLGVCMYVKFMKHIAVFLFVVSILALLSIAIYEIAAVQLGFSATEGYSEIIYSTTIGVLSSQYEKCGYDQLLINQSNFNLKCSIGEVKLLKPVLTNDSLESINNCGKQNMKYQANMFIPNYTSTSTNSSPSNYDVNVTIVSNSYNGTAYKYIAMNYMCVNGNFHFANVAIPTKYALYAIIIIDYIIILMFTFFLCSQHNAQIKQNEYFEQKQLALHDFAVKIKGFNLRNYEEELQTFIQGYNNMRNRIKSQYQTGDSNQHFLRNIVQIKLSQIQQIREAIQRRRKYYQMMYDLISECFFDDGININRYKDANDFIKKCYGNNTAPEYKEYKKQLTKLIQKFMESKRVKYDYNTNESKLDLFMVLTNPKHKRQMFKNAKNPCMGTYLKINNKKYYISEPPIADMVIWENKHKFTIFRAIFAYIITIGICFGSYLLVGFAKFKSDQSLRDNKFGVNCNLLYTQTMLTTFQQTLYQTSPGQYMHCYCFNNYFSWSKQNAELRATCNQWFFKYITYQSIPILISLGIVIYNLLVSRVFRKLSRLQAHNNLSSQLYSYIIKRSFMLIMNMGLIIILLKLNFRETVNIHDLSFLFMGIYNDITTGWYYEIGVIIIMTLAINILMPFFDMIFVSLLKCFRKCWDRKCYCRKTSQKTKKGYIELYSEDVFPIQERYSDFIATIVIVLTFSAVMPVLYVIGFLTIWFMFISDKLLLFRIYQKPINYAKDMQYNVFKIIYIALMAHCVVSAFLLSEPHLFYAGGGTEIKARFSTIITTPYLIPYAAIFGLLVVWAIFYSTFVKFFKYIAKKCEKNLGKVYKQKFHQNFFGALNQYQINKLKLSVEMQMNNNIEQENMTGSSHPNTIIKKICQNTLDQLIEAQKRRKARPPNEENDNITLIGKAGYDEIFDNEVFLKERKIKSLDYQFNDLLKKERALTIGNDRQNTISQINPYFST